MNEQLNALAERFWDRSMEESPSWATILGDHRFDAEVEDLSAEHEQQTIVDFTSFRDEAEAIDPTPLSKDDRITRHVLISEVDGYIGAMQSRQHEYLVDPMLGLHMDIVQGISQFRANEDVHAWAFVDKASKVGRQFDQLMERHRQDAAIQAAMCADTLLEKGDLDGYAVWRRILEAIRGLHRTERSPGSSLH